MRLHITSGEHFLDRHGFLESALALAEEIGYKLRKIKSSVQFSYMIASLNGV